MRLPLAAVIGWDQILYTGICTDRGFRAVQRHLQTPDGVRKVSSSHRRDVDYPSFQRLFEAQSLGDVLPFIRAHRPKFPHPVYDPVNYRIRNAVRF
jgi:hypothetical protein